MSKELFQDFAILFLSYSLFKIIFL